MIEQFGKIAMHYTEATPIVDPATGDMSAGEQLVIILKAEGDEKEYTHQLAISPDLPGTHQLTDWQKSAAMVVLSAAGPVVNSFQHQEKDEDGNPKKYPMPGKVYKVANRTIEIGTMVTFRSYAIRVATAEDEQRAKEAYGRFMERQQLSRMRSIGKRQEKAKVRTAKTIQERKQKKAS
jgi:hypothetical protein